MTSGDTTYVISGENSVTLPVAPASIRLTSAAKVELEEVDGDEPYIFVTGLEAPKLTVTGILFETGKDKADLEIDYVNKLLAMKGTIVTLTFAKSSRYDGQWILSLPEFSEAKGGATNKIHYTLEFIKGKALVSQT